MEHSGSKRIELLSPGGSLDAVYAAVSCGCDAVYLGGKNFSARNSAENFDDNGLKRIIDYCRLRGVKVFLTINTLYKDSELSGLLAFADKAYVSGVDAFVMQDIGCFDFMKKRFNLPFHASTQMTAHNLSDVLFLQEAGFNRIVLSRELSLAEIRHIAENTEVELEVFIHGALCYSYSGACLMSAFIGGRSGNRGRCAQPCRLKYDFCDQNGMVKASGYLLSPKDMMGLDALKELSDSGITSLKIEGRLKSPEYVAIVTQAYRTALDEIQKGGAFDRKTLSRRMSAVFNRGGFSGGYFNAYSGRDMISESSPRNMGVPLGRAESYNAGICRFITSEPLVPGDGVEIHTDSLPHIGAYITKKYEPGELAAVNVKGDVNIGNAVYRTFDKELNDEAARLYKKDTRKLAVRGTCVCEIGKPLELILNHDNISVRVLGDTVESAQNQPLSRTEVLSRLAKTGDTTFEIVFDEDSIVEDGVFIRVSALNELRRKACQTLKSEICRGRDLGAALCGRPASYEDSHAGFADGHAGPPLLCVLVSNEEQFVAAAAIPGIARIYAEDFEGFTENAETYSKLCKQNGIELYAALGQINRGAELQKRADTLERTSISGYLLRNPGQFRLLSVSKKNKAADFCMNVYNGMSNNYMRRLASTVAPSLELNISQLKFCRDFNELLIYGRTTLMTTALCLAGIYAGGKNSERYCKLKGQNNSYFLRDRTNAVLPIMTDCGECYARLINDKPVFMLEKLGKILNEVNAGYWRLAFTYERAEAVNEIIAYVLDALNRKSPVFGTELQGISKNITYGHYFRGCE